MRRGEAYLYVPPQVGGASKRRGARIGCAPLRRCPRREQITPLPCLPLSFRAAESEGQRRLSLTFPPSLEPCLTPCRGKKERGAGRRETPRFCSYDARLFGDADLNNFEEKKHGSTQWRRIEQVYTLSKRVPNVGRFEQR